MSSIKKDVQDGLRDQEAEGRTEQAKGAFTEIKGKVKSAVGDALGDANLQAEGAADQVKGKVQKSVGDAHADAAGTAKRALD